mgnify:FL=1
MPPNEQHITNQITSTLLNKSVASDHPEAGPALLFFSGGTALKNFTRVLTRYTHNSIHILSPFDSGGSSAVLRNTFGMPAVGDVRSRLMALADQSLKGSTEAYALANYRFENGRSEAQHLKLLEDLIAGTHLLIRSVPSPLRETIIRQLDRFKLAMPSHFDLNGASIGNLILAGNFLGETLQLNKTISQFAELLGVQGEVQSSCDMPYHLAVELENGEVLIGQHRFTGKQTKSITSAIQNIWLTKSINDAQPVDAEACSVTKDKIASAELICYPPGSFYSSLIANLLPSGVGQAIARSSRPKVYIPNLGRDPEQYGLDLEKQVEVLLRYLKKDASATKASTHLRKENNSMYLDYILVDNKTAATLNTATIKQWAVTGIELINAPLVCETNPERYDDEKLCKALLSLAKV